MELWEIGVFCLSVSLIGVLFLLMKLEKKVKSLELRVDALSALDVPDQEDPDAS